jgi:ABC-2 type transport system ATP-binding protein
LVAGKVSDILNDNPLTTISSDNIQALNTALKDASFVQSMQVYKDRIELRLIHGFSPTELNRYLYEKGIVLSQLIQTKKSLEAEFLERTN